MIKNLLTLLFVLILGTAGQAQSQTAVEQGMRYIEQKASTWNLQKADYKDALISDMYTDKKTGNTYIYFQQAIDGIPVEGAITPVVISKDGKAFNVGSKFIPNIASKVQKGSVKVSTADAVVLAATHLGIQSPNVPVGSRSIKEGAEVYTNLDFAHNDVKVTKNYVVTGDAVVLAWDLSLDLKGSADYWNTKISSVDGSLVDKHNYTLYCKHSHDKFSKHSSCGATAQAVTKTTTTQAAANAALMMGATYNVFAFPTESPIHGERSIITDGQYPDASPHGWHDTNNEEGPEYTITRGNNVHVYLDLEDTGFSENDEVDGGMDLNFDREYDLDSEHRDNVEAGQVNLFTTINLLHDVTHRLGFDEAAGNFQVNSYGNGGQGGDAVAAQALDGFALHERGEDLNDAGFPTKINNASFATPADGFSPTMQMFLWENTGGALSIDSPANIAGFVNPIGTAVGNFGGVIPNVNGTPIEGKIVIARDSDPASPTTTCGEIVNADEVAGNIALIDRGLCFFSDKALNAQNAGAISCIICNVPGADGAGSSGESVLNMGAGDPATAGQVSITPIMVPKSYCDRIRTEIANGNEVRLSLQDRDAVGPAYRDAAFDNGVVAHEFAHGISNRLVGGPGNTLCLRSLEQMGEGISDLFSLILTVEEGDTRTDNRGIGNYVDHLAPNGGGIRTYPYSTDLAINPRDYSELPGFAQQDAEGNDVTQIYPLGEVWASTMWDMYWNIVDNKGLDVTWNDETAGNYIAGRLAIEGMKLVPCNPTMLEMRDAVLGADELLYDGEHELEIWTAFARRGMGWQATGGTTNDVTDGIANYEIFPLAIEELKIDKTAKAVVDSGEEVEVTLSIANHVPETKSGVVITDNIPEGASYVEGSASIAATLDGTTLTFNIGDMEYRDEAEITYMVRVDSDIRSNTLYYDKIDGSAANSYDIEFLEGFSTWSITTADAYSEERALYVRNSADEANDQLLTLSNIPVSGNRPALRFYHKYDTEAINDGGFLQISTDGGTIWNRVQDKFLRNGYNNNINYSLFAIPNLEGFSGSSGDEWVDSYVDLSDFSGETISLRLRFGSDAAVAGSGPNTGWLVDDIEVLDLKSFNSTACIASASGDDEQCSGVLEFFVNSNGVVSTEDVFSSEDIDISIAPNPAQEYVTVKVNSEKSEPLKLDLTTLEGKHISTQVVPNSSAAVRTFDVSQLQSGVYFLTVRAANQVITTEKIVIE